LPRATGRAGRRAVLDLLALVPVSVWPLALLVLVLVPYLVRPRR
jgi:hypothetical protein